MIPVLHGVWAAAGGLVGDFEHIETQTVGAGGAASVTFSSIPGTYKHLQVRWTARSNRSGQPLDSMLVRFNGDTTATNYSFHQLYGSGASATSNGGASQAIQQWEVMPGATATASIFGVGVYDVLDYTSTSKNTTIRELAGNDQNGSGYVSLGSGAWYNTNAITSVTLLPQNGTGFVQHSTFALYGVK